MILNLARLRRFARANSGLAALEFALIAPMMIFLIFASAELINALQTNRRVENVASSIADVVARDNAISNSEVSDLWSAVDVLMYPVSGSAMSIRITSINIPDANNARVVWSEVRNAFSPLTPNSTVPLPANMMVPGSSVIRTETKYTYNPPLNFVFSSGVDFTHTAYRRSRLIDPIPRCATC